MLAFARQQHLQTRAVDIAALVTGMRELLERSLGPRVSLRVAVDDRLPAAQVDANQVELAILNLAINARTRCRTGRIEIHAERKPGDPERRFRRTPMCASGSPTPAPAWTRRR